MVMELAAATPNPNLDAIFAALADPTRRGILKQLSKGSASVAELAQPYAISQPAISKHLKVLERAGLVTRAVDEQRRPAQLAAQPMAEAAAWLDDFSRFWADSFDEMDALLAALQAQDQGETT